MFASPEHALDLDSEESGDNFRTTGICTCWNHDHSLSRHLTKTKQSTKVKLASLEADTNATCRPGAPLWEGYMALKNLVRFTDKTSNLELRHPEKISTILQRCPCDLFERQSQAFCHHSNHRW